MISRILVPLDGSDAAGAAIPYATSLLADGGQLVACHVIPDVEPLLAELLGLLAVASSRADAETEAAGAALDREMVEAGVESSRYSTLVTRGDPAEEILKAIDQQRIDLVAMSTQGLGAIGRLTLGSVADRISRSSPVPVLLVRSRPDHPSPAAIRRLVVPLDGSPRAEGALPLAAELAGRLGASVHLVQAINPGAALASLTGAGAIAAPASPEVCQRILSDIETEARDYLATVAARLAAEGVTVTWAVLEGSPYFVIADATEPGDLLVMTSHGRGGIARWVLGSVAEKLVRQAPVPVLLVPARPPAGAPKS